MKIYPIQRIHDAYLKNNQQNREKGKKRDQPRKNKLPDDSQVQLQTNREEKLEQLKRQIANGTYHVDSQKIAEKMISLWKKS